MKVIAVYDDTAKKSELIADIIGDKGFGDVVVKKRHLYEYYKDELMAVFGELKFLRIGSVFEFSQLPGELELYEGSDVRVIHCFSDFIVSSPQKAALSFAKLSYIDEPFCVLDNKKAAAVMFPSVASYSVFCKNVQAGHNPRELARSLNEFFEIEGLSDISLITNFIRCITGTFDSRYFNSLQGNDYTLVKSSSNTAKIKAEYTFYHLLPDDMKYWFVLPFDYREENGKAFYSMERLHMTDLAIKWVHGSMDEAEFEELMDRYFYFFSCRHKKDCSKAEYRRISDSLYVEKIRKRIGELKNNASFGRMDNMLKAVGVDIDDLADRYFSLKEKIEAGSSYPERLVIGHGDPCFANALYNRATKTLKFIDPRGALTEAELWTNEYYDVAKLSHSVCGSYDFFNNALFELKISPELGFELEIPFDNRRYKEIFRKKAEENGFDYLTVRVYEASLFLSMLPLHMDNPQKVLGFILNAQNILKEIEADV